MNDADKEAFEVWWWMSGEGDQREQGKAWQAACEWRDSQAVAIAVIGKDAAQRLTNGESLTTTLTMHRAFPDDVYLYIDPPAAQINQQLMEALEKITEVNQDTPVKTYQEMERIAKAALAAAKETK